MSDRVTIYIPSFGDGGVERNMVLLSSGFAELGVGTDLLLGRQDAPPFLERRSGRVNVIWLPDRRGERLAATVAYLRNAAPAVMLSSKPRDDELALQARRIAGVATRIFLRCGTHLSMRPEMTTRNPIRRWRHYRKARRLFRAADGAICVSEGVADDLAKVTGLSRDAIAVIRNPTVTPDLELLASAEVDHPWFAPGQPPVVLGVGALAPVKRFEDLVRAVAMVLPQVDCRLVILGEGKTRASLLSLAVGLGIADRVELPGYVPNPLAYMRRARVLVLSSEREGSPNALTEALACGTPVVATDCPSGPREILAGGRYGPLVPVGDVEAMARAIVSVLRDPLPPRILREALTEYTLERACLRYLEAFDVQG